jgi:hypothetical protein
MKRTRELHMIGLRIELRNVFVHKICGEEMFIQDQEGSFVFDSISLLMEMFVNYLESNDMASVEKMTSGSMKVT